MGGGIFDSDSTKTDQGRAATSTARSVANDGYEYDSENGWTYDGICVGERCDEFEPKLLRSTNGVRPGLDIARRHHALGNAVNPRQVYPIVKAIADIENGLIH